MVVHRPRQYPISELLEMRYKLPVVCCPIRKFGVAAWDYDILRVQPAARKVPPLHPPPPSLDLFGPAFLTPLKANPGVVHADSSEAHRHQQQHNVSPVHHNMPPLHQTGTRTHAQRRGPGEGLRSAPQGNPTASLGFLPMAARTGDEGFRRYGPAPTTPQTLAVFEPTFTMDPFRPNLARAVARHYPQTTAAFAPHYRPLDPALAFQGFTSTATLQNARSVAERMAAIALDRTPSMPSPATPALRYPVISPDLSGGYPGVTIGAAGYTRGAPAQGFVPGGSLKSVPLTALSATPEKDEPLWADNPRLPPAEAQQYDPNQWILSAHRNAFDVLKGASYDKSPRRSMPLPGGVSNPGAQSRASSAVVNTEEGKGKAVPNVTGEDPRLLGCVFSLALRYCSLGTGLTFGAQN